MQYLPDAAHSNDGDTVQAVTNAVTHVAVALDELKDQLEIANRRVSEVAAAQITEAELGRLFVRAAQFADTAMAEAEDEAREVVAAARREAERILADARTAADAMIEEGERSSQLGVAAAEQVQATIEGFTRFNQDLMRELEFLRDAIQPELNAQSVPPAPSLPAGSPAVAAPFTPTPSYNPESYSPSPPLPPTAPPPPWVAPDLPTWRPGDE
jgi:cell division septum initiation protein DivIVA